MAGMLALGVVAVPGAVAQETGPVVTGAPVIGEVSVRTLAKGLKFDATFKDRISSRKNKVGDILTGVLVNDVNDATGTLIFPAKSTAMIEIMDIKGMDQDHAHGTLVLVVRSVNVGNLTFRMQSARDSVSASRSVKNPTWTREPKKMETPAAAGAVASPALWTGVVGRAPQGAVVGTNLVVSPGTAVTFELAEAVTVTS
jgi:hypothetical protein